jgi:hypothetical protein
MEETNKAKMNTEEKFKLDRMEQHIKEIQKDIANILNALIGNSVNGNTGITSEIRDIKEEQKLLHEKIELLETNKIKNDTLLWIMQWVLGVISTIFTGVAIYWFTTK